MTASFQARAQEPADDASVPKPTLAEVPYGEHERHVLDFWKAESDGPTPLAFVIHGGAWVNGSKEIAPRLVDIEALLRTGISVVSINYRLIRNIKGVVPPVRAPLHDAARALQFVRSKAEEWNIDKERILSKKAVELMISNQLPIFPLPSARVVLSTAPRKG